MIADSEARRCRECGLELPPHAPGGRCPNCLLTLALSSTLHDDESAGTADSGIRLKRILGDYELLEELGRGGMGVVWKARKLGLNRVVALKTLPASSLTSPELRLRFRLEIEAVARLNHPNIVALFDTGECQGLHFYTMTLVEGGTLAQRLSDPASRPVLRETLIIFTKVAHAIHYAHQRGILHRDLKPSNILLEPEGEPRIADFGLARPILPEGNLTQSGAIMGSPHYMAPEQARGEAGLISTAVDVYSLGAILYEIVAGRPPFVADTTLEILDQVRHSDPPPPSTDWTAEGWPGRSALRDLDTIALKCLRKEPVDRFGSARELALDVERWLRGEPIEARPVGTLERAWRWCRREPALASALGFALLMLHVIAAGALWHGWRMDMAGRRIASQAEVLREQNTTLRLREAEGFFRQDEAASAVATLAGLVRADPRDSVAAARLVSALQLRPFSHIAFYPLSHPADVIAVDWIPEDHRLVTVAQDGVVRTWDALDGHPIAPDERIAPRLTFATFAHGRQVVVAQGGHRVVIWNVRERRRWVEWSHPTPVTQVDVNPDGRWVATADETGRIRVGAIEPDGALTEGLLAEGQVRDLRLRRMASPRVFSLTTTGVVEAWDLDRGERLWRHATAPDAVPHLEAAPDGSVVVVAQGTRVMLRDGATGAELAAHFETSERVERLQFGPDGSVLAAVALGPTGHFLYLWPIHSTRAPPVILEHAQEIRSVAFSSDGRRVLTGSSDRTVRQWYVDDGRASGEAMLHARGVREAQFGPGNRQVVSACFGGTVWVWRLPEARADPVFDLDEPVISMATNSDGTQVAVGGLHGRIGLWRRGEQGWTRLDVPGHGGQVWHVEFSPDGDWLASAGGDGLAQVWNTRDGSGRRLAHEDWRWVMRARFSPQGTHLVTAAHDGQAKVWEVASGQLAVSLLHPADVGDACFSPDSRFILTRCQDSRARLWEATTGRLISEAMVHSSWVDSIGFSPDGRWVLTASRDNSMRRWDLQPLLAGQPSPAQERWLSAEVTAATLSTEGNLIAAVLGNHSVQMFTAEALQYGPALSHQRAVFEASFDPSGQRVVTAAGLEGARIWEISRGRPISEPLRHEGMVFLARFMPDGRWVLTAGEDGTARLWPAPIHAPLSPPWLADLAEATVVYRGDSTEGFSQENLRPRDQLENVWRNPGGLPWEAWDFFPVSVPDSFSDTGFPVRTTPVTRR